MKRIFAWVTDGGACTFYRIVLPLTELARYGWEVRWGFPEADVATYDVVVGSRLAGPNPEWLALCADPGVLTVYDMDDDLLNLDPENTVPYAIYAPLVEDTRRNVAAADVVTVCTPHVAEVMSAVNPNVHLLPICLDPLFVERPLLTTPDRLTVGWGGSPFHHQDWVGVPDVLRELARRVPRATFHTIGADYTAGAFGDRLRVGGYGTLESHMARLDLDVGIAPLLRSFSNRGKSWTKPLEYAARGTPVVAQRWGQYVDWVREGENGFTADTPAEWLDALVTLCEDDALRGRMSATARADARRWTIDRHIELWKRAYAR